MSGLLSPEKYLPIRYCPLQIELEFVTSAGEAVRSAAPPAIAAFTLRDIQFKSRLNNVGQFLG